MAPVTKLFPFVIICGLVAADNNYGYIRSPEKKGISDMAKRALEDPRGWDFNTRGGKAQKWKNIALKNLGEDPTQSPADQSGTANKNINNNSCLPSQYQPSSVVVKWNSSEIYVNGNRFIVRGVGYSPIPPGKKTLYEPFDLFTAGNKPIWKRDVPLIAKMGSNLIRVWSWDATLDHTDFMNFCHDHDIMIMVPFLVSAKDYKVLGDPDTHHTMLIDFKAFVQMVKNHPALFGYLIGNELNELYPGQTEELLSIVNAMVDIRDEIDDARHPLTIPLSDNQFNKKLVGKYYPFLKVDFWALQIYRDTIDWVLSNYSNILETVFPYVPRKPLILTEYGIDALSGDTCERWNPKGCGQGKWTVPKTPAPTPMPPPSLKAGEAQNLGDDGSTSVITFDDIGKMNEPIPEDPFRQAYGFCVRYRLIANPNTAKADETGGLRNGFNSYIAGGVIMEYADEWWKGTSADARRTECPNQRTDRHTYCAENINKDNDSNAYYLHEEWLGLMSQTDPPKDRMRFCVQPRLAYYAMSAAYSISAKAMNGSGTKVTAAPTSSSGAEAEDPGVAACFDIALKCQSWGTEAFENDLKSGCSKVSEEYELDVEGILSGATGSPTRGSTGCTCQQAFTKYGLGDIQTDARYCANMHLIWNNPYVMMLVPISIVLIVASIILARKLKRKNLLKSIAGMEDEGDDEQSSEAGEEAPQEAVGERPQPSPVAAPASKAKGDQAGKKRHKQKHMKPEQEARARNDFDLRVSAEISKWIRTAFWRYSSVDDFTTAEKTWQESGEYRKGDPGAVPHIQQVLDAQGECRVCPHFHVAQRRIYSMVFDVYMRMTMDPTQIMKQSTPSTDKLISDYIFPATRIVYEKYMEGYYLYKESPAEPLSRVPFREMTEMYDNFALYTIVQTWAGTINHSPEKCCEVFDWGRQWFPLRLQNRYDAVRDVQTRERMANPDQDCTFEAKCWRKRVETVRDLHHGFVEIFRTYCLKVDQTTREDQTFSFDDVNTDALYLRKMLMKGGEAVSVVKDGHQHPNVDQLHQAAEVEDQGAAESDDDVSDAGSNAGDSQGYGITLPPAAAGGARGSSSTKVVIGTEADLLTRRTDATGLAMTHGEVPLQKTHLEYNTARNPEESVVSDAAREFFELRSKIIKSKWFPEHIAFPQKGGIWALFLNFQWLIRYILWQGLIAQYLQPASVNEPQCLQHFLLLLATADSVWNFVGFLCHYRTLGRLKRRTRWEGLWTFTACLLVVVTCLLSQVFHSVLPDSLNENVCKYLDGSCEGNLGKDTPIKGFDLNVATAYLIVAVLITFLDEVRLFLRTDPAYTIRGRFSQKKQYRLIRIGFLLGVVLVTIAWVLTKTVLLSGKSSPFDWWPGLYDEVSWVVFPVLMILVSWGTARLCGKCAGTFEESAANKRDLIEEVNYLVANLMFWGIFFGVNWWVSYSILVKSVNNINWDLCKCDEKEGVLDMSQEDLCQEKVWTMCYIAVLFVWISAYLVAFTALYAAFEILLLVFGVARAKYVRVGNVQNWSHVESYWEQIIRQCMERVSRSLADERNELPSEERRKIQGLCERQEKVWNNFVQGLKQDDLISDAECACYIVKAKEDPATGFSKPRPNFRNKPKAQEARRRIVTFLWGLESLKGHDGHAEEAQVTLEYADKLENYTRSFTSEYRKSHRVRAMPTWTTLVPTYNEAILLSRNQLKGSRDAGSTAKRITELEYVQLTHVAEWQNFAERIFKNPKYKKLGWIVDEDNYANDLLNCFLGFDHPRPMSDPDLIKEIELWCSMRGQTLARTIQGLVNQRNGLLQLAELEEQPITPFDRLQVMRTVARKYQILITHQTFEFKKLGSNPMEGHLCEMWRKLKFFDVVINEDSTFQSHCLRLRDELLFPTPPTDGVSESRAVTWSLDGIRSPPFPSDRKQYPQYGCPCITEKNWEKTLEANVNQQFDRLLKWCKNKDRAMTMPAGTLVRVNPNSAGGVKHLVMDKGGKVVPLSGDSKTVAGGKWLEGRIVKHIKPLFESGDAVTDHPDFADWSVGKRVIRVRSATNEIRGLDHKLQAQWMETPKEFRPLEARHASPQQLLDQLGLQVRKWNHGLLIHQVLDTKPGGSEATWAKQLNECTARHCKRSLTVPGRSGALVTTSGWTITAVNGKTFKSDFKDKNWESVLCEQLREGGESDEVEIELHAFPMWGDGEWKHPDAGAPGTGSLGMYQVEYDLDGRVDYVDFENVEPFPWTKLTVQRVSRLRIGEGKAENQIHALPFATGEVMQAMDMNQYATGDQAIKIPFLLNDFFATPDYEHVRCNRRKGLQGRQASPDWNDGVFWDHQILVPPYRILGFPEWCYTRQLSMVGDMMGAAEWCFVTINQRVLSWPLRIRTHYGHPDFFDGYWSRTRGGTSKASHLVNTNEDIFAGYEMLGRGERGTYVEFLECHKGRETSFPKATVFEAKLAQGAAQQIRSIDVYMLNRKLDVFQRFGLFFASIAFYVTNMIMSISISYYILGIVLFAMSGVSYHQLGLLDAVIAVPWLIQIGYVLAIPMIVELIIQRGFWSGLFTFIATLPVCVIFFVFQMRTKTYYFLRGLIVGAGGYAATGRGFGLERQTMIEMYKNYSESHYVEGFMVVICLFVYGIYGSDPIGAYLARTFTIIIIAISWLWAPLIFNPMPTTQELQVDVGVMVDWISTKLKKVRKGEAQDMIKDVLRLHSARLLALQAALIEDLQRKAHTSIGGGGDGGSTFGGTDRTFGATFAGGADTSAITDRSDQSSVSAGSSVGSSMSGLSAEGGPSRQEVVRFLQLGLIQKKLLLESDWFRSLCEHNNRSPAFFSKIAAKQQLKPEPSARNREIFIELLDTNGVPIGCRELSGSDVASRHWLTGTGSGSSGGSEQSKRADSRPSQEFMSRLFEKLQYPIDSHGNDLSYCQNPEKEGGWIQQQPLLVIRCRDTSTHSTIMKAYRDATRLTDGMITMRPGELSDSRPYAQLAEDPPKEIHFLPPKSLEQERDSLKVPVDFREELQYQGSVSDEQLNSAVTRQVYCVTKDQNLDIFDTLRELHSMWYVRHGRQLWLQEEGTESPPIYVPPVFAKLRNKGVYRVVIQKEEFVHEEMGEDGTLTASEDVDYAPRITLKMRLQTFDEWSQHRIPTFRDLNGLRSQFWTSEDGRTPADAESWMAWWYRNVLFFQWESEDLYFGGIGNLVGNVAMRLYLNLEFYFPWALIAFAFWDLDSLFYLWLIVGIGILFKMVDKNTKQHHEYAQLLKALGLFAAPFAIIYFQHALLSFKKLFWSLVFYFVAVNLLLRLASGFWNVRARRKAFGNTFQFNSPTSWRQSQVGAGGDTERGGDEGGGGGQVARLVTNRINDVSTRNQDELKQANVFQNRLLMPRILGMFRRVIPVAVMIILALGNFICVTLCTWLMAMMYNGRVAEAWRRAYFRSTATAAPAPSAPPPPPSGGQKGGFDDATAGFGADALRKGVFQKAPRSGARSRGAKAHAYGFTTIQEAS
eukprot:Hpha_TRINITY_DN14678_c0_g1::TRINITY_DN14678_c0_g1_i1::g.48572::m.48572